MSEYIVNVPDVEAAHFIEHFGFEDVTMFGYHLTGEIVRCRDCKCFEYCRFYAKDKDKPNGFCAWGERKEA